MIREHEVIEQIEEEPNGRPFNWVSELLTHLGAPDPLLVLQQMWRAGYLTLVDGSGQELKPWQCEQIWRGQIEAHTTQLLATPLGSKWVHGS